MRDLPAPHQKIPGCNIEIFANIEKFRYGGKRSSTGDALDIALAVPKIHAHFIFGNTLIPNSVTSIGSWAFVDCIEWTDMTLPHSVTSIGDSAFYFCNSLTDIYYTGSGEQWNMIDINSENDPLLSATIHFNYDPAKNPFEDVNETDYFAQPVLWAVEKGITTGTGKGKILSRKHLYPWSDRNLPLPCHDITVQ